MCARFECMRTIPYPIVCNTNTRNTKTLMPFTPSSSPFDLPLCMCVCVFFRVYPHAYYICYMAHSHYVFSVENYKIPKMFVNRNEWLHNDGDKGEDGGILCI